MFCQKSSNKTWWRYQKAAGWLIVKTFATFYKKAFSENVGHAILRT